MIALVLAAAIVIGCQIPAARNHDRQTAGPANAGPAHPTTTRSTR